MDEVDGGAGRLPERDRPREGELLRELGVHEVHVRAVQPPLGAEALVGRLDQLVVLRVDRHEPAVPGCFPHGELDPAEVEPERGPLRVRRQDVRREHLEARKAGLDRLPHLGEDGERQRSAESDVKAVVDVGAPGPAGRALIEGLGDPGARTHEGEVDVRGRAAARHAAGVLLGTESQTRVVGMGSDRVGEVRVGLDAARRDDPSRGVENPGALDRQPSGQRKDGDLFPLDTDVP